MERHIKYTNLEATPELKSYLENRLQFLNKLSLPFDPGQAEMGQAVQAWIEVGRVTRHHKEGKIWYAECNLRLPSKKNLRVTSTNYSLDAALDEVKEEMELLVKKAKEKHRDKIYRKNK